MAYPKARSLNEELKEGATDNSYKKAVGQDKGGVVELATWHQRRGLAARYGIVEAQAKIAAGMVTEVVTPLTVPTKDQDGIF